MDNNKKQNHPQAATTQNKTSFGISQSTKEIIGFIIEVIKTAALMAIIAFAIRTFLVQTYIIEGISMEPNFHNRELILVDKISYRFSKPQRGEVVILIPPRSIFKKSGTSYIKRIIGLPGETIKIYQNEIFINNKKLEENYLPKNWWLKNPRQNLIQTRVYHLKENEYFVMGDNRGNSEDSRSFGPITFSEIQGRAFLVFYPFKNFHLL